MTKMMSARLGEALSTMQRDVDNFFDKALPVPPDGRARLIEAMRYSVIGGGKRVRPLLCQAAADLFGVDRDVSFRVGCAVEAIHVYSLIHDDLPCMDDDALRHGRPTLHRQFDEATAVLAGDSLHAFAFEILSDRGVSGDPFVRAGLMACLATASGHNGMAGGQMMDLEAEKGELDLPAITRLQQLKTGALLGAAVEMGMVLGHVREEGRTYLRNYARDIGLAFQIADDLLDVEGDEGKAGKALRKDAGQGKQTFVTLMGAEQARAQAQALVEQAVGHLSAYGEDASLLKELARYVVERDY